MKPASIMSTGSVKTAPGRAFCPNENKKVAKTKSQGIVICRNGQGICIAVNKVKGIRGVTGFSVKEAKTTKLDDDAKELLFDALLLNEELSSAFESRNLQMITDYLYKLSARLHKFYANTKVMGHPEQDQLLKVFATVALSLRTGLSLLGITAVYRMEEQA